MSWRLIRDLMRSLLLGLFDKEVQMSVSRSLALDACHGSINYRHGSGMAKIGFQVDNPKHLKRPSIEIQESLFKQARKLGLDVKTIEISVGRTRVYTERSFRPIGFR